MNDPFAAERHAMVERQLRARGIRDERVLRAFEAVPRHRFVPQHMAAQAYGDYPLAIGHGQTISQPYIVALMLSALRIRGGERVLDVGSGSGYQSALLREMGCRVYAVERVAELLERSRAVLADLGYDEVHLRLGDGSTGWPEEAPFDRIVVGAAAPAVPASLRAQLAEEGILVVPVGDEWQQTLRVVERRGERFVESDLGGCVFVRLIGKEGF